MHKEIKYFKQDFHSVIWVMHGNVAYKIEGEISRTGYKLDVYPSIKLVCLGRGKRLNIINFFKRAGNCDGSLSTARSSMVLPV